MIRFLSFLLFFFWSAQVFAACAVDVVSLRNNDVSVQFQVEIADTVEERAVGLMNRSEMPVFSGMLFVYPHPQFVSFWMKNTLIPLDMLFLDETGTVVRIHKNAKPLSLASIPGGGNILAVLEVNGGASDRLGLDVGTELQHPAFNPDLAAWPCPED